MEKRKGGLNFSKQNYLDPTCYCVNLIQMKNVAELRKKDVNPDLCESKTGKFEEFGRVFGHKLDTNCNSEN